MGAFNAAMLTVARQMRGFSQTELARALRSSQSKISKIEAGIVVPDDALMQAMGRTLQFRPHFFTREGQIKPPQASYHRKRKKLSATEWDRINAKAEVYRFAIEALLRSVDLVPIKIGPPAIDPDQYDGNIDRIAAAVRQAWMLPRGPVSDVVRTIENSGIVIVPFDFGSDLIDAFCQHAVDRIPPLIFLNSRVKSKDRLRYSLLHEVGHLCMHTIPNPEQENQANQFAAAFLMPAEDIQHELYGMSMDRLMVLKAHWKASMQAILIRARDLKRMSDRSYRYYQIELSKRGWRSAEPIEIDTVEEPKLFRNLLRSHTGELGYSSEELADMFGIYLDDMPEIAPQERPKLRLVTG
jgi:Zn-dependent peptidase ImmA (M78 family)/transcriptional regulator with XRE-family HTH domain